MSLGNINDSGELHVEPVEAIPKMSNQFPKPDDNKPKAKKKTQHSDVLQLQKCIENEGRYNPKGQCVLDTITNVAGLLEDLIDSNHLDASEKKIARGLFESHQMRQTIKNLMNIGEETALQSSDEE